MPPQTCFSFPAPTETFGNVTLEAMASGLAVVAYDYAAAQQYLHHGVSGLLAPRGDAGEFAQMAARLARNRKLGSRFGLEAERVLRHIAGAVRAEIDGTRRESAHVET